MPCRTDHVHDKGGPDVHRSKNEFFYLACNLTAIPPLTFVLVSKDCSQRKLSNGLFSSGLGGTKAEIQLGTSNF